MAQNAEEYKSKLRKHYGSQMDVETVDKGIITDPITEEELIGGSPTKPEVPVVNMKDFEIVDMNDKMNLLMSAINKINTTFHHKFEAMQTQLTTDLATISPKIATLQKTQQELQARVDNLESHLPSSTDLLERLYRLECSQATLKDDMAIVKGTLQVQDKIMKSNQDKVIDLTARSMANNVIITGIPESSTVHGQDTQEVVPKENCKEKVLMFMRGKMKMEVTNDKVEVAHRTGKPMLNKPRQIVVRCKQSLRDRIFKFTVNLKDELNEKGEPYYVRSQLPEPLATLKREREEWFRSIKKSNAQIPDSEKHRRVPVHIKNNTLFIKNVPQKQHIFPPSVKDIFNIDPEMRDRMNQIQLVHSDAISEKSSHFVGHAARVKNSKDVNAAYKKVRLLYPESDHIILVYAVKNYTGHHDHGEFAAGSRILQILLQRGMNDTVLFVTRDYGGIQLGQRRFIHIENAAREALNELSATP